MNQIAVDRYIGPVWYDSFADVVADFTSGEHVRKNVITGEFYNELYVYIGYIVQYNTCYRDYLRAHGIDALIEHLCEQAPAFRAETDAINTLRRKAEEWGPLGDYDIQCQGMYQDFFVHDVYFRGIGDVRRSVELYQRDKRQVFPAKDYVQREGIHILCNYEPYPQFDISDAGDDREYVTYFFFNRPITREDLDYTEQLPSNGNNLKISERLDRVSEIPMLYYKGDGPSILLVTPKEYDD